MNHLKRSALAAVVVAAGFTAAADARAVTTFVTNAYDLKVQQISSGSLADGTSYATFAGDAKAANNKLAADLKGFSFTVFYGARPNGVVTVTGGTFVIHTTNKDRSPLTLGGNILPGDPVSLGGNGWIGAGETLFLPLTGGDGTGVGGVITVTVDKSTPPRASGSLSLTYPVIGQ